MNVRILFITLSLLWVSQGKAFTEVDATALTRKYYALLKQLSNSDNYIDHSETNTTVDLQKQLMNCVLESRESFCAPNESRIFGKQEFAKATYFSHYFGYYMNYARDGYSVGLTYNIASCDEANLPSRKNDLSVHRYYYVRVRKEVTTNGSPWKLWELLCIDGSEEKIMGIGNDEFGGYNPESSHGGDYNHIMSDAAWAYQHKRYDEAYDKFLQASELNPYMCEPFYRMALMIYFKKGVKGRFKNAKTRRETLNKWLTNAMNNIGEDNAWQYHRDASNLKYTTVNGLV